MDKSERTPVLRSRSFSAVYSGLFANILVCLREFRRQTRIYTRAQISLVVGAFVAISSNIRYQVVCARAHVRRCSLACVMRGSCLCVRTYARARARPGVDTWLCLLARACVRVRACVRAGGRISSICLSLFLCSS